MSAYLTTPPLLVYLAPLRITSPFVRSNDLMTLRPNYDTIDLIKTKILYIATVLYQTNLHQKVGWPIMISFLLLIKTIPKIDTPYNTWNLNSN